MKKPNPGSIEAVKKGCICPIMDNHNGYGLGNGKFWITEDCPIHAPKPKRKAVKK